MIFERSLTLLLSERPEHLNLTTVPTCTIWMDGSEIEMEIVAGGLGPPAVGGGRAMDPESASAKNRSRLGWSRFLDNETNTKKTQIKRVS